MSEEFKEVTDYKKIFIIAGIIVAGIAVLALLNPIQNITLPELIFNPQEEKQVTEKTIPIKQEYEKYLDLGISYDDVLDFQDLPCQIFDTPEMISPDSRFTAIIEQRKIDCGL